MSFIISKDASGYTVQNIHGKFVSCEACHRALWQWALDNPHSCGLYKAKKSWPGWEENGGLIPALPSHCFACAVSEARSAIGLGPSCDYCPITEESVGVCCKGWYFIANADEEGDYDEACGEVRDLSWDCNQDDEVDSELLHNYVFW